jgi:hypothetical protein
MHRFPLGRGRWIAAISSIVILVGCVLPWYTAGDKINGLPPLTGNAFDGPGILVFLAALATLALVTMPYAAGDRPVGFDRWPPYLIILIVGIAGLLIRAAELQVQGILGLPDRSPGLWIAALGLIGLARATFEIAQSTERR